MSEKNPSFSPYYDKGKIAHRVADGQHRGAVGDMWDEIGQLQFDLMRGQGLASHHKLLDIGCGSLRGGVHFVHYLDAGNYFGIDINQSLLDAGYDLELTDADRKKLPRDNLRCGSDFDFGIFDTKFDRAIALSVFTHMPFNHIRVCLERLAEVINPGGRLLASFSEIPADAPSWTDRTHQPGNVITHASSDPYHYRLSDFFHISANTPWTTHYIGNVDHPRAQRMIVFERGDDQKKPSVSVRSETRDVR